MSVRIDKGHVSIDKGPGNPVTETYEQKRQILKEKLGIEISESDSNLNSISDGMTLASVPKLGLTSAEQKQQKYIKALQSEIDLAKNPSAIKEDTTYTKATTRNKHRSRTSSILIALGNDSIKHFDKNTGRRKSELMLSVTPKNEPTNLHNANPFPHLSSQNNNNLITNGRERAYTIEQPEILLDANLSLTNQGDKSKRKIASMNNLEDKRATGNDTDSVTQSSEGSDRSLKKVGNQFIYDSDYLRICLCKHNHKYWKNQICQTTKFKDSLPIEFVLNRYMATERNHLASLGLIFLSI